MKPTQIGTTIAVTTVIALVGITAYKGNREAVTQETRGSQEQMRSKYQVTIAQEIISNGTQYPSYDVSPELGGEVSGFANPRLNSFRGSRNGLYYAIAQKDGRWRVIAIYSAKEIQTTIDLIQKEQRNEKR